jgi:hypothetical protein
MSNNKKGMQIKQQIFHHFAEIVELYPQYSVTQHMIHVMRPQTGSYQWNDEELLKKFEKYRDELENELVDTIQEED